MAQFHMESDARARSVAKQLRMNLSARGIRLSLGKCLDATARLYGYPDWRALGATTGGSRSEDDAFVGEAERAIRHRLQCETLVGLGLDREAAEGVRAALAPTGRSGLDADVTGPVMLQHTAQYHPIRMLQEVDSIARRRMFRELREAGENPTMKEGMSLDTPQYPLMALAEDVEEHIHDVAVIPLDELAFDEEMFSFHYGLAQRVTGGKGDLLDASVLARRLAADDVSDERYSGAWDGMPVTYVHLGTNAFPSPFPFAGIEGCYVEIGVPNDRFDVRRVEVTFVASPENVPGLGLGESLTTDCRDAFLWNMRTVTLSVDTEDPRGEVRIGDIPSAANGWEWTDEYVDMWRPFLAAPLNAAWNAVRAERAGTLRMRDGVLCDVEPELVRKLTRARTPEMRRRAVRAIAEENGEAVVRFVGGVPEGADLDEDQEFPVGVDAKVEEPRAWAEAYFRMAIEADLPEAAMRFAQRGIDVLESHGEPVPPTARAKYHMVREMALSVRGRWGEALAEGRLCSALDGEDATSMMARIPALAVRAGDEATAREAAGNEGLTPAEAAWSRALVAARFGDAEERDAALVEAVDFDPGTAATLARPAPAGRASERDIHHYRGEVASIASLHRDGWAAIGGYRDIIRFAASRHESVGMRH